MYARFSADEADAASEAWGFNCGPGALCGVLDRTPAEIRPHLLDFEAKRYTNPTLMLAILRGLGVPHRQTYAGNAAFPTFDPWPKDGLSLLRVQWDGPWTKPGVPMAARYRHSHWIGVWQVEPGFRMVFDVNAMTDGGWLKFEVWEQQLVPWLLKACEPKATGRWWPTNVIEVRPGERK